MSKCNFTLSNYDVLIGNKKSVKLYESTKFFDKNRDCTNLYQWTTAINKHVDSNNQSIIYHREDDDESHNVLDIPSAMGLMEYRHNSMYGCSLYNRDQVKIEQVEEVKRGTVAMVIRGKEE